MFRIPKFAFKPQNIIGVEWRIDNRFKTKFSALGTRFYILFLVSSIKKYKLC